MHQTIFFRFWVLFYRLEVLYSRIFLKRVKKSVDRSKIILAFILLSPVSSISVQLL